MPKYSEEYIQRRKKWWMECNKYVTFADYGKAVSCAKSGIKHLSKRCGSNNYSRRSSILPFPNCTNNCSSLLVSNVLKLKNARQKSSSYIKRNFWL